MLFDGIALIYIMNFKGLQAHPMKIFMMISLSNFCFMWPTLWGSFICRFHLDTVFQLTAFMGFGFEKNLQSLQTLMMAVPF